MNIKSILELLKNHAKEEVQIHKDVVNEIGDDVKEISEKHLQKTMSIHKTFWRKLGKAIKKK